MGLGLWAHWRLDAKWKEIDRYYPEPTAYQKGLKKEAELFLQRGEEEAEYEEMKNKFGIEQKLIYKQMYSLNPHPLPVPDPLRLDSSDRIRYDLPDDQQ